MKMRMLSSIMLLVVALSARGDDQISGVGTVYWHHRQTITSATTPQCLTEEGSTRCALFPAGTAEAHKKSVTVAIYESTAGFVTCHWVGDLTSTTWANTGAMTDTGGLGYVQAAGAGSGFRLLSTYVRTDEHPNRAIALQARAPGTSLGLCTESVVSANETLYPPCRVLGDCTAYSGGTCNLSPSSAQLQLAGMKLACNHDGSDRVLYVRKERVTALQDQGI